MSKPDVERRHPKTPLSSRVIFENQWMQIRNETFRRTDGSTGIFSIVSKSNSVVVVCEVGETLLMVDQYRYAAGRWSLELPQGGVEPEEDPAQAAIRELREETGWLGSKPEVLSGPLYEAADWATQSVCVVHLDGIRKDVQMLEPDEAGMVTTAVRWSEFPALIVSGRIVDATTLAALFLFKLSQSGEKQ